MSSKQGDIKIIKRDFQQSVQRSYDQGLLCAKSLLNKDYVLMINNIETKVSSLSLKEIYIFCVLSDHYPCLFLQHKEFSKFSRDDVVKNPLITDIFFLDTMTEMLDSPLYFLSYIKRRAVYDDNIFASQEAVILSHHLTNNLWINDRKNFLALDDTLTASLDLAMHVRRNAILGSKIPEGILTWLIDTKLGKLIKNLNDDKNSISINIGLFILNLSKKDLLEINLGIDNIVQLASSDNYNHDCSLFVDTQKIGITIHCDPVHPGNDFSLLVDHCYIRKYISKAEIWFGLSINLKQDILCVKELCFPWVQSDEMDIRVSLKNLSKQHSISKKGKIGRNKSCYCGSSKKYKYCCLGRFE